DKAREKFGKQKGSEEESGVSSDEPSDNTSIQDNTSSQKSKQPNTKRSGGNMRKWLMGLLALVLIASLVFNVMSWQQAQQTNDKLVKMDKKVQNTENGIVNVYREVEGVTGENGSNDTDDGKSTEDKLNDISTKVDSLKAKYESFAKEQREQNEDIQQKLDTEE